MMWTLTIALSVREQTFGFLDVVDLVRFLQHYGAAVDGFERDEWRIAAIREVGIGAALDERVRMVRR